MEKLDIFILLFNHSLTCAKFEVGNYPIAHTFGIKNINSNIDMIPKQDKVRIIR